MGCGRCFHRSPTAEINATQLLAMSSANLACALPNEGKKGIGRAVKVIKNANEMIK